MTSLFGDVFLLDSDNAYWFLSLLEGTLERKWLTPTELQETLDTESGQDHYLLAGLAVAAHNMGLVLEENEVYAFQPPPILGGGFEVENVVKLELAVALTIAGQLHHQVQDMKPGDRISEFTFRPEAP